jgi:hypothetical protein
MPLVRHFCHAALVSVMVMGCVPAQAPRPTIVRDADPCTRQHTYDANQLTFNDSTWSPKWSRGDGEYALASLNDVFDSYPQSREVKDRVKTRSNVIGVIGGAGGFLVGFTLGFNVSASDANRMSTSTQTALYATGGGLLVTALVTALLWPNPANQLAPAYNAGLHDDLSPGACPR